MKRHLGCWPPQSDRKISNTQMYTLLSYLGYLGAKLTAIIHGKIIARQIGRLNSDSDDDQNRGKLRVRITTDYRKENDHR